VGVTDTKPGGTAGVKALVPAIFAAETGAFLFAPTACRSLNFAGFIHQPPRSANGISAGESVERLSVSSGTITIGKQERRKHHDKK
jgi:hypothetical protein